MKLIFLQRTLDKNYSGESDRWLYEFVIKGSEQVESFSETKLLIKVGFVKGREYEIKRGEAGNAVEVSWADVKIYIKNNNSIIKVNKDGTETNLSESILSQFKRRR